MTSFPKINHKGSGQTHRPLQILIVEDSEIDAFLLEHALQRGGLASNCLRVDTADAMSAALDQQSWDVILADHSMPQFSAPEALQLAQERGLDVPFIIVSGHIEEETAVAAMKAGAHDYIMKDRLARLVPAVERELREAAMRRTQREYEAELRRAHDELEMRVERRTAALKEANEQLQSAFEERRRLENELLEIAENERRSIGFDLHDDLGQKLIGLSMMASGLERRLAQEEHEACSELKKIGLLVEQMIHHTHNLAHQFSSMDAQGDDLLSVLEALASNVKKMFTISCAVATKGEIPALPSNTITQLYKIAQEAVNNAVKHGKGSRVWISAHCAGGKLLLSIRNDGVPFSGSAKKNRLGLRIMNYRANTIGAKFEIKAHGKQGTIVTCSLPIKNRENSKPQRDVLLHSAKAAVQHRLKVRHELAGEPVA